MSASTPARELGALSVQVDNQIQVLGRERPVCWIRVVVPIRDHPSLQALHRMKLLAESSEHLVKVISPIDDSTITYVFTGDGPGTQMCLAMYTVAQTKGTAAWRIDTGETGR